MNMTLQFKKLMVFALGLTVVLVVGLGAALTLSKAQNVALEGAVQTLTNEEHGYSLHYPAGYDVLHPNEDETVIFVGSLLNVEQPRAYITVQGADGRTAGQVADELAGEFDVDFGIQRTNIVIDGEKAVVLDHMPGQDTNRQVMVVHNDRLYTLTFVPAGEDYGQVYAQMEKLYATVIDSFTFLAQK
jgi:hypothetical protein